ncbi:MAG: glycosyltransferase [Syntrophales bacterium]|nr:glycosyltransferase [Syntrophales bacterium]
METSVGDGLSSRKEDVVFRPCPATSGLSRNKTDAAPVILSCGAGNIGDNTILSGPIRSARAPVREARIGAISFSPDFISDTLAALAGFESWMAQDCFIHHFGSRTFIGAQIDYRKSLHRKWGLFKEKWGMPREMPYGSYTISPISPILEKGFIPEKHYLPLPDPRSLGFYHGGGVPEKDNTTENAPFLRKTCTPGMVSIIIPVTGSPGDLKTCVGGIEHHTPEAHEILFIDGGCKNTTLKRIKQIVKKQSNYRLVKAKWGANRSQCYNRGIEASSGEYLLLLDTMVTVTDGWLGGMLGCVNSAGDTGIVGPMTNRPITGIQCAAGSAHLQPGDLEVYAVGFHERNRFRRIPSRKIAGLCMLFRRSLAEQTGPFDEDLEQGNASDDYCLRAALKGYQNCIAGDVFVTCPPLPPQGSRRSFQHKWGGIDAKSRDGERLAVLNAIEGARRFYQEEDIDGAIRTLIDRIGGSPDDTSLYYRLAEILIDSRRFKDALDALGSLPEDARGAVRTLELKGYGEEGLERYNEAGRCADRALALNASSVPALNLKGMLAHKRGDNPAAEEIFIRAINVDPGFGEAYTHRGILAWETGRTRDALDLLEKGFILSPTVADTVTAYHTAITETAQFERAVEIFREAKTVYPRSRRIAFFLIDTLIRQKQYEPALREIWEAMITFGVSDGILSAAQAVLGRINAQRLHKAEQKPSVSLCMIVKNEEQNLPRCLMSALPVVDEMIIVDTGSTDRTRDIAKAFGARVYAFEWTDNFSEARNCSLSKAGGDWILVLDADEAISPLDYDGLATITQNGTGHPAAYAITTRNYIRPVYATGWTCNDGHYAQEEAGTGWYPSVKVRLFSNDKRIRFENSVHELVEPSLRRNGITVRACDIPVHHYGQLDMEHYVAKGEAYYLLGRKKLEEKGDDLQSLVELAIQAGGELGKHAEAVDLWKRVLILDPLNVKAFLNMGYAYLKMGKHEEARAAGEKALALDPELKEAVIVYTTCEALIGDAGKTIPMLEGLLKKVPEYPMARAILAAAQGIAGNKDKGLAHIKHLMNMGFACADYLHDMSARLVSEGRCRDALSLLNFAVESGNGTEAVRALLSESRML